MSVESDKTEYFKDVVYLVEASSFEQQMLWETEFQHPHNPKLKLRSWEDEGMGHGVIIGKVAGRPINLSLMYAKLNGKRVCFFHGCSLLVDHQMIEKWLLERTGHIRTADGRWAHCDSMNFGQCFVHVSR